MGKKDTKHPEYMGSNAEALIDGTLPPQLKQPTLKQRRLFVELTRQATVKDAVVAAGYSPRASTSTVMQRLSETTLRSELVNVGFNPESVAKMIWRGARGMMVKPLGRGEYKLAPDWGNRHKYLQTALRMFGVQVIGTPREPVSVRDQSVHLNVYKQVFNLMERSIEGQSKPQREIRVAELDNEEEDM